VQSGSLRMLEMHSVEYIPPPRLLISLNCY